MNKFIGIIAVGICVLGTALVAQGAFTPVDAPEIDPGAASSAIALLACGVLILAAKRKKT